MTTGHLVVREMAVGLSPGVEREGKGGEGRGSWGITWEETGEGGEEGGEKGRGETGEERGGEESGIEGKVVLYQDGD